MTVRKKYHTNYSTYYFLFDVFYNSKVAYQVLFQVELSTGEAGVIEGSFGKSGKIKITITEGLKPDTYTRLAGKDNVHQFTL